VDGQAGGARDKVVIRILIAGLGLYSALYLLVYLIQTDPSGEPLFGDFFAFWSFAKFLAAYPAAAIYDPTLLQQFQLGLDAGFHGFYPFPYPPSFGLLIYPLGYLPYRAAAILWSAGTLGLYLCAVAGRHWASPRALATLAAPATLLAFVSGQNGFLTAALLIGGFRLLPARPILGGALLGVLSYKPQFFVMIPLILLAAGRWRGLAAMAASAVTLAGASALCFGIGMWESWIGFIPAFSPLLELNRDKLAALMPTIFSNLVALGVTPWIAQLVQGGVAVAVVVILFRLFRQGIRPLHVAALQVGLLLATPYALVYDLPIMASAVTAAFEAGNEAGRPWRSGESAVLLLALLLPVLMTSRLLGPFPLGAVSLLLLFGLILRIRNETQLDGSIR